MGHHGSSSSHAVGRSRRWRSRVLAAVFAIASALATAPVAPAAASFPGNNGLIAYACGGICTVNPDGTNVTKLTTGTPDITPAWSADGTKIVFVRQEGSPEPIY